MRVEVIDINKKKISDIELDPSIFGINPREDILSRVIRWQLSKRRSGNHKTKERGEVSGSTKKIVRQKGTGGARHGSKRAVQFRKGGVVFGPLVRSHAHSLQKKVRKLGLKMALSSKFKANEIVIVNNFDNLLFKSKLLKDFIGDTKTALIIDSRKNDNLLKACSNLFGIDLIPSIGANVYDILRKERLILTIEGLTSLEERLK